MSKGALAFGNPPAADCEGGADIPVCPSRVYANSPSPRRRGGRGERFFCRNADRRKACAAIVGATGRSPLLAGAQSAFCGVLRHLADEAPISKCAPWRHRARIRSFHRNVGCILSTRSQSTVRSGLEPQLRASWKARRLPRGIASASRKVIQ